MIENFLNQSANLNFDINVLYNLLISIICGLAIRFTLPLCNQNWVQTLQHTLSYAMLPPITFIITKVISGNIALSLGMVGALSIVRFRTPVKNSFELVVYFLLLTIGITGSVDIMVSITLTIFVNVIILLVSYIKKLNPNREVFESSYLNDYRNFLSISTDKEIDTENFELVSFDYKDNLYDYVLSGNKEDLLTFQNDLIKILLAILF